MNLGIRRNWWQAVAISLVGGAIVAGWFGLARHAQADSPPTAEKEAPVAWTRSTPPSPAEPKLQPKLPEPTVSVVPASAVFPAPPVPTLPVTPLLGPTKFDPPATPQPPSVPLPGPAPMLPSLAEPVRPAQPANSANSVQPVVPSSPDFNLRPANTGNTVKPDDPVPPPLPVPQPVTPVIPVRPVGMAPTVPELGAPPVPEFRTKPPDAPIAPTAKDVFLIPGRAGTRPIIQPTTPGGNPMNVVSQQTVFAAVTGVALAFAPTPTAPSAVAQDKVDPVELKKQLDETKRKLEDADKEIKRLSALLEGKRDETGKLTPTDPGAVEEIRRLRLRVDALEAQVNAMKTSTSLRPANALGTGTVRVVNDYPVEVSIMVNEKSYRIAPGMTLSVEIPAGEFTYQLLQTGATATRSTIKDKEVVTLRVR